MSDISNILITVCGFCTICCGALGVAMFLLFRVTGRSLLIPAIAAVSDVIFNRGSSRDDDDVEPVRSRRAAQQSSPTQGIQARIEAANQDFNQTLGTDVGASSFRQAGPRTGVPPEGSRADRIRSRGQNTPGLGNRDIPSVPSDRRRSRRGDYQEGDDLISGIDDAMDDFLDL